MVQQLQRCNAKRMGVQMTSVTYLQPRAGLERVRNSLVPSSESLLILWWIHTLAVTVWYNNRKKKHVLTVCVMFLYLPRVASSVSVCIGFVFGSLTLQEAGEPQGWCFRVPREPIPVIHINNAEPLGVAHSPLKVVQEWPCEVSTDINSVPAPNNKLHQSFCWLNDHSRVAECKMSLLDCLCNGGKVSFEVTDSRRVI